jgi:hypothetical protein
LAHVEDAHWIESCLKFRQAVAEEFERLLCAADAVMGFPEVDDGEPEPVEQGGRVEPQLSNPERTRQQVSRKREHGPMFQECMKITK